jgi:hypothetical protein
LIPVGSIRLSQAGSKERKTSIRFPTFFTKKTEDDESVDSRDAADRESASLADLLSRLHTKIHHGQSKVLIFIKEASGYRVVHWFRNYSAFSVVASSAFLVSATNFSHGKDANACFLGMPMERQGIVADGVPFRAAAQVGKKENLSLVPLAAVNLNADPDQKDDTTLFDIDGVSPQNQIVLSSQAGGHLAMAKDPEEDGGVKIYTVSSGDTVSGIAAQVRYHIKYDTMGE